MKVAGICAACKAFYHGTVCGCVTASARAHGVIGDEIDETHEDLDPDGGVIRFRSRQEKQRYLDARGLQPFVRHVEGDHHVRSWATSDPYTLAAATALVSRC